MFKIITLDFEKVGIPEDGFGIDSEGNFFVAISKGGFFEDVPSLVFIFCNGEIIVKTSCVKVLKNIRKNNIQSIMQELKTDYEKEVIKKIIEMHLIIKGASKVKSQSSYLSGLHTTYLLSNILSKVYHFVGPHYGVKSVNLKKKNYYNFFLRINTGVSFWKLLSANKFALFSWF